jgi:energy-coupling factor transporter ATP-binding protein EcfA2
VEYLNGLCARLVADEELQSMMHERLDNDDACYNDDARHITTTDFFFYVGKRLDMKRLNRESTDANVDIDDNTDVEFPNDTPSIWVYSPGEGARKWQECLDENVMLLGWDDMENFRDYETRQDIVERLREVYGNTENAYTNDSLAIWQFCREMRPGDIVYVKRGLTLIVGRGVVKGGYTYNGERYEYKNSRAVEWTHSGEWEYPKKLPMKTLTRINDYKEMVERLEGLFDPQEIIEQISFNMPTVIEGIKKTGLLYEDKLIKRYACSLMTKPFVILSGLAGSGKTQLALAFARVMSEDVKQQLCVVPVGADWTNREPLLGYPNALKQGEYMLPESGALQIMMRALRNPQKPYFLVLDEMNLSYVERYFADFLSALESHEEIPLWEKPDECDSEVPAKIALPRNLFIIGTINVDETTYMFSPKVLDRANVIEFKISDDEMDRFLKQNMNIDVQAADGLCANMGQDFVAKSTKKDTESSELAQKTLCDFFKVLKKVNAEFGYRSATEIYRFIANAKACAEGMTEDEILDATIVQKLLPKLHGSRKKLEPALKALWGLSMQNEHTTEAITRDNLVYAKFPEAADKVQRMMQTALDNGFTSFAEA